MEMDGRTRTYVIIALFFVCLIGINGSLYCFISAPSLGVYYFLSLTLHIASSFLFLDRIESFFGYQFSVTKTIQNCFLRFLI